MALGIMWHNKEDVITFPVIRVARPDQQMTKRGMLSVIMKIFDLLGYLSPFLVKAKVCYKYCGVKELIGIHLPQNMLKDWQDWIAEIPSISEMRLPRCLLPVGTDCIKDVDLHGYGDASEMEYGSMVYLRITIVLDPNRASQKSNIAAIGVYGGFDHSQTSFFREDQSRNEIWMPPEGPDAWPTAKLELTIDRSPEFQAEVRKSARELHVPTKTEAVPDAQKYSSLTKLFNVTAYVFRFITNCKVTPEERKTTPLDNEEFSEELESLKQERKLPKSSRLWPLNPYIDDNGVLRVSGRVRHSDLPFHTMYPFLLSNQHPSPSDAVLSMPEILDYEWSLYRETSDKGMRDL
ncbi:hypothetical protein T12_6961 [Trichinella patagoniensis]|uniref:Uncharacterized protein n=1 Tax=Trichinella patagoniensis TaxID=990121 RepID=A0A0V0ZNK0_9BILA|nr:hypothetical protein T12_6961 [Trichinella patagoniensis]